MCEMSAEDASSAPGEFPVSSSDSPPRKKARMLKIKERKKISDTLNTVNDAEALCKAVRSRIDAGLDLECFPDRQAFWCSIKGTAELEEVVKRAAGKYMELYRTHGKGRVKYSSLYRQYQLTFTDLSNDDTKQLWEALASCHQGDISDNTRRVLLCGILQGVQTWVQQKISVEIRSFLLWKFLTLSCLHWLETNASKDSWMRHLF